MVLVTYLMLPNDMGEMVPQSISVKDYHLVRNLELPQQWTLTFTVRCIGAPIARVKALEHRIAMHNVTGITIVLYFRVYIIIVANDKRTGRHLGILTGNQFTDRCLTRPFAFACAIQLRWPIQPVILVAFILDHRVNSCCAVQKYGYTPIGTSRCTAIDKSARRRFAGPFAAKAAGNYLQEIDV